MRRILGILAPMALACGLTGCGPVLQTWEDKQLFLVSASPLCETTPGQVQGPDGKCVSGSTNAQSSNKAYLGQVVTESETLCGKFLNELTIASNTSNTSLDIMTTIFTALGTAFTPLATVHALTAAGSVSSGAKTAIDSDVYAKATVANYAQAIRSGYYTDIQNYLNTMTAATDADLDRSTELAKIQSYHSECSMGAAQNAISTTLSPTAPTPTTQTGGNQQGAQQPAGNQPGSGGNKALAPVLTPSGATATQSVVPGHPIR